MSTRDKVIGLVNYREDKDYIPSSSSRRPSNNNNKERLSARSLLSNDKVDNKSLLSARSLLSLESDDNNDDGENYGISNRTISDENYVYINDNDNDNEPNGEERKKEIKELQHLRRKVVILETTVQEACKLASSLLSDDSIHISKKNSTKYNDAKMDDLLPLLTSLSSNYKKLNRNCNELNTDIVIIKDSHKNNYNEWEDQMLTLQKVVKDLQEEDVKNKRMINITIHNLEAEKDNLKGRNQDFELINAKLLHENENLKDKINDLEGALLDIPRLEDKYLREAKKIVHEKALAMAQTQINMKKMQKEVQSLAFYQSKVKDLEENNTRLRLANESLQRQCRVTLRKVHDSHNNSSNFATKSSINANTGDTQPKVRQRPVSAAAILSSINIEDSFEKSKGTGDESNLLLAELKVTREKNYNLEQKVSSLRHKLAIARSYPLKSASAGPLEVDLNKNKNKIMKQNNETMNTTENITITDTNTHTKLLDNNEDDDESYFDLENQQERENTRLQRSASLSADLRNKILTRQSSNQANDPHTENIRTTKKFPTAMKILNKFLS